MITVGFLLLFLSEIDDSVAVTLIERIVALSRLFWLTALVRIFRITVQFDLEEITLAGSGLGIHGDEFVLHLHVCWFISLTILFLGHVGELHLLLIPLDLFIIGQLVSVPLDHMQRLDLA